MRNFKKHLIDDMALERTLLAQYEQELKKMPSGTLTSYRKGKKVYYKISYQKIEKHTGRKITLQKHLKVTDTEILVLFKRKAFVKKSITKIRSNLSLQEKLAAQYAPYHMEDILQSLGRAYKNIGLPVQADTHLNELQTVASRNASHPENLTQPTLAGFYVRSKSEALIVNAMFARGIRFVYEEPITLKAEGGGIITFTPDFVIHLPDGRILIWEHFGMLGNETYLQRQMRKIQIYHLNDFVLGKNLFLTADDANGRLDMDAVIQTLDIICGLGGNVGSTVCF